MRRPLAALALSAVLLAGGAVPAAAYHDRGECNREGNCNDQRRRNCEGADGDCRGSFSPSFEKSPVDHSFNLTVCVMPGSCTDQGQKNPPPPKDGQAMSVTCLVPVPYHCDKKPS